MTGTLSGNIIQFKWVWEGAETQPDGEMRSSGRTVIERQSMRTAYFRIMWLALTAACLLRTACASAQETSAGQQSSVGRGARDPIQVDVIVGSEGKGMFTSAGVPPDNMPIYAAKDGATPPGVEPLPLDIFMTKDFYKDRDLWLDRRYYRCNSPSTWSRSGCRSTARRCAFHEEVAGTLQLQDALSVGLIERLEVFIAESAAGIAQRAVKPPFAHVTER
jgi:hypothetical protein